MKTDGPLYIDEMARPDGRPECYDIPDRLEGYECVLCRKHGLTVKHSPPDVVMTSPAATKDGRVAYVCVHHCPGDVVIFNPRTGLCRDKKGNQWDGTQIGA